MSNRPAWSAVVGYAKGRYPIKFTMEVQFDPVDGVDADYAHPLNAFEHYAYNHAMSAFGSLVGKANAEAEKGFSGPAFPGIAEGSSERNVNELHKRFPDLNYKRRAYWESAEGQAEFDRMCDAGGIAGCSPLSTKENAE